MLGLGGCKGVAGVTDVEAEVVVVVMVETGVDDPAFVPICLIFSRVALMSNGTSVLEELDIFPSYFLVVEGCPGALCAMMF
jgi:hypothetical protein